MLADVCKFLANSLPILADVPILARATPEFFDKTHAGEFTPNFPAFQVFKGLTEPGCPSE